ncbi:hypothetical protein HS041_36175 [Planomonospora sp. ID67723]|uniref:hypothetical protein n=1 Tax=Planomonospora sp. ID67723 TaxID=2738134 RepID=UPI0018C44D0A|nr:hypothetical protein [Planomonospora sp. ID67723]MBG0833144.1 hypothetical protein [Planomonospora sp. ID67723]
MRRTCQALAALTLAMGGIVAASPARAGTESACPVPAEADVQRSAKNRVDRPPRGAKAVRGLRVGRIPEGFSWGRVNVYKHDGLGEYGYVWSDDRDDTDRAHRLLWVRVACWPEAARPAQLSGVPFVEGTFSDDMRQIRIGGRTVLTKEGDGALGHGRYAGWVERKGVVITVMASEPLVAELAGIIKGITLR